MIDDETIRNYLPFALRVWHDKNCTCGLPKQKTTAKNRRTGRRVYDRTVCRSWPCIYDRIPSLQDLRQLNLEEIKYHQ